VAHQRDWTAEKYRRFDRGERIPSNWQIDADRGYRNGQRKCGAQMVYLAPTGCRDCGDGVSDLIV